MAGKQAKEGREERMECVKRDGAVQGFDAGKVRARVSRLVSGLSEFVEVESVVDKVCSGLYSGVSTEDVDHLLCETCAYLACKHPDYSVLAGRLAVTRLHKHTIDDFAELVRLLGEYRNEKTGTHSPLVSDELMEFVAEHAQEINQVPGLSFPFLVRRSLER